MKKVDSLCGRRNTYTAQLLREAGVSRNAFYSLARKDSVVPWCLIRVAERLDVPVSALLEERAPPIARVESLLEEVRRVCRRHRGLDPDNVRHTLLLLDDKPLERLRRALRRGRQVNLR